MALFPLRDDDDQNPGNSRAIQRLSNEFMRLEKESECFPVAAMSPPGDASARLRSIRADNPRLVLSPQPDRRATLDARRSDGRPTAPGKRTRQSEYRKFEYVGVEEAVELLQRRTASLRAVCRIQKVMSDKLFVIRKRPGEFEVCPHYYKLS